MNNKQFNKNQNALPTISGLAKLGGKVITRTSVQPLTISYNPNGVQSSPNFAKPPGRCRQAAKASRKEYRLEKRVQPYSETDKTRKR